MKLVTKKILKIIEKKRPRTAHKGQYGHLLIVGGSKLYHGSPTLAALSAKAAYRSGVDLVTVAAPERAANIIASFSPDVITWPLKGDYLSKKHLKELNKLAKNKDAIVIGGGLCRTKQILITIRNFLKDKTIPCVIDADAIYAYADGKGIKENMLFTPHAYEFKVLTKTKPSKANAEYFAKKYNCTILLKGPDDIITNGKEIYINKTGSPYMTVGGTGDTLAGICGSMLAQGLPMLEAAALAAFINGKAGELLKKKKQGMMASDLIEKIPDIL